MTARSTLLYTTPSPHKLQPTLKSSRFLSLAVFSAQHLRRSTVWYCFISYTFVNFLKKEARSPAKIYYGFFYGVTKLVDWEE